MTQDEHRARAMLLGREYIGWAHAYVSGEIRWVMSYPVPDKWLDADTLEPLHPVELFSRVRKDVDSHE